MKPNEFVKMHGLQYTKSIIEQFPKHTHVTNDGRMFIDANTCASHIKFQLTDVLKISDLKHLVESHELVEKYKRGRGIRFRVRWGMYRYGDTQEFNDRLKQAIADVKSCMELTK